MTNFLYTLIIYPLYEIIECIYVFFYKVTYNTCFSVIGVSIGITLLCLPLYAVAEKWQQIERDKQKAMEGQLERIKKTFTGDERYMMTTAFYKENNYNPIMALRSSFGLLIQIPFFMAAYSFLSHSISGSFYFIKDMGKPDSLFSIGNFSINVLPLAMTLINIVAGAIYTKGFKFKDKAPIYGMALIFLVILYNSPSGLVLYWTMNNVFSLIKNIFYKLKNPLKSFYIMCCALLVPASIFVLFKAHTKIMNRMLFLIIVFGIYCLPFIVRVISKLLDTKLSFLTENKKERHTIFILSSLILCILIGYVIPSSLVASSPIEFTDLTLHSNPQFYINNTFIQAGGLLFFWALCIYFLFSKRIQTIFAAFMTAAAFCAIVNTYIFVMNYGDISNTLKFLSCEDFGAVSLASLLNIISNIAIFVIVFIFLKTGKIFTYINSIFLLVMAAVSIGNTYKINSHYMDYKKNYAQSDASKVEPIFTLSKNQPNVLMLYLDMAQTQFVEEQIKENPDFNRQFSGFINYPNVLSFNGHTIMGSPGCYGGYESTPPEMNRRSDIPLVEKHNQALLTMPRIFNEQAGYSAVITDPSWPNYKHFCDLSFLEPYPNIKGYQTVGNYYRLWASEYKDSVIPDNSDKILKRNILFFSIFRSSPVILRKLIYKNGNYWNTDESVENGKASLDNYSALSFLPRFAKIDETSNGSFVAFINQLTHENDAMIFEAPDYKPVAKVTKKGPSHFDNNIAYHTQMASFKLLGAFFDYLRENGIYDNTRIVIVSDHGGEHQEDCFEKNDALDKAITGGQYFGRGHYHCLLMFKDFNASGAIKFDDTFMTNADTPSLLLNGLIENPVNPFTGKVIPTDTYDIKKDGVYISAADTHQPANNGKYTFSIKPNQWWHVKDNIFISENWKQEKPDFLE